MQIKLFQLSLTVVPKIQLWNVTCNAKQEINCNHVWPSLMGNLNVGHGTIQGSGVVRWISIFIQRNTEMQLRVSINALRSKTHRGQVIHSWWRHKMETFPRYWPFLRGIHRSPVNSPVQRPVMRSFDVSLIFAWINDWVNNREAGD